MTKKPCTRRNHVCVQPWGWLHDDDSSSASENDVEAVRNDEEQKKHGVEEVKKD